jgi:hypothetical protein
VTFYPVPMSADFNHNFLGTTKTNEKPCTITPCYSLDEEILIAHSRELGGWIAPEKKELAALQPRKTPIDMDDTGGKVALAPLASRPTPDHPATKSIIPQ